MKKQILGTLVLTGLLLNGCGGSDKPEEVAVDFVKAIASADMKEATKLGTDDVDKSVERVVSHCNRSKVREEAKRLRKEIEIFGQKMQKMKESIDEKEQKQKELNTFIEKLDKDTRNKYHTRRLPADVEQELGKKILIKTFDIFNVDDDDREKYLPMLLAQATNSLNELALKNISKKAEAVKSECVQKYFDIKEIDDINVLEVKAKENADETVVRLEVVYEDKKSEKFNVPVENIQKEWQVSSMPFGR